MDIISKNSKNLQDIKDANSEVLDKIERLETQIKKDQKEMLDHLATHKEFRQAVIDSAQAILPGQDIYKDINFGYLVSHGFGIYVSESGNIVISYSHSFGLDRDKLSKDFEKEIKTRAPKTLALDPNFFEAFIHYPSM